MGNVRIATKQERQVKSAFMLGSQGLTKKFNEPWQFWMNQMKIAFRLECPHCKWGHEWRDQYVNQGWIKLECGHCEKEFFAKIHIPVVQVETSATTPDAPVQSFKQ